MWITQVELHNIKSYGQRTTISLAQGVNAICGKNGAGKSTILEAIGFTLFGKAAYSQEQFIHEKAKKGEIIITLFDSRDERYYQVVRPVKGGPPHVYDPEIKRHLATGAEDVQHWLRDCMRVDPTTDLKVLFENAIGVTQGLLTVSFLETEANRRKVFDPLLNVADYKQAWENLRAVATEIKEQQSDNKADQSRLEGQLEPLAEHQAEARGLQQKIQAAEAELAEITRRLDELDITLTGLGQQKELIEQLTQQVNRLAEQAEAQQEKLQAARSEREQARQAQAIIVECQADYQVYEQAQQKWATIEQYRPIRDEIRHRLADIDKQLALLEQHLHNLNTQLQSVAKAEARLVELAPLVEKQQQLEEAYRQAQKAVDNLTGVEQRLAEAEKRQQNLQVELIEAQTQLALRQQLTQVITQLEAQRGQQLETLNALSVEIAGLEQQLGQTNRALEAAQAQLKDYEYAQTRLQETSQTQTERQAKLPQIENEVKQRRQLETELETLIACRNQHRAEIISLETQIEAQNTAKNQAQGLLTEWKLKIQALETHQANLGRSNDKLAQARDELASLEQGLVQRQDVQAQLTLLEAEQSQANEQRDTLKDSLSRFEAKLAEIHESLGALTLEADSPCPVCRKPLSEHDLLSLKEHYLAEIEQLTRYQNEAQVALKETESQLKRLQRQLKKQQADLENLPNQAQLDKQQQQVLGYQAEAAGLEAQIAALREAPNQVAHFENLIEQIRQILTRLKQQHDDLRQTDRSDEEQQQALQTQLHTLARPAEIEALQAELHRLEAELERWQADLEQLKEAPQRSADLKATQEALSGQKAKCRQRQQEINQAREGLAEQVRQHQVQLETLAGPGRVEQLQAELEAQITVVAAWRHQADGLTAAPEQLKQAETALSELGDPRREAQTAQDTVARRPGLEADLAQIETSQQELQPTRAGIEQELLPYANLDTEAQQVNDALNRTRAAHQRYLEHKTIAEALPSREARVAEIQQAAAELIHKQETLNQQLAAANAGYDPADHQTKQQEREGQRTRCTELNTQVSGHSERLAEVQSKIEVLAQVEAERAELQHKGALLVRLLEVVEFIRRTIKDAGPEITRRLVKAISVRADRIYGDIINDHQQELTWDETYGITLRRDGYERDFQQLSGGEAMAAALAVRLALLQSMSAVEVAFFDEPTANLDPERRANLAEQIARIKGFSQLVVISHDDTFEQDTGHVIHIAKDEQGYSRVVA